MGRENRKTLRRPTERVLRDIAGWGVYSAASSHGIRRMRWMRGVLAAVSLQSRLIGAAEAPPSPGGG